MDLSASTTLAVGNRLGKYRIDTVLSGRRKSIAITYVLTNPMHFSAKDSFARSSNRFINRFRWMPNYAGNFSAGATYTTGATTSFYWAWTTATTQFMAARAVDDTHSSSLDIAGVVIETESTFRIPDDLHDKILEAVNDKRGRAYSLMPSLSMDYGTLDLGSLEPRTLELRGKAITTNATTSNYLDIEYLSAAFQQRKRLYIIPPSGATAIQGYAVEMPVVHDANAPVEKGWTMTVAVAQ